MPLPSSKSRHPAVAFPAPRVPRLIDNAQLHFSSAMIFVITSVRPVLICLTCASSLLAACAGMTPAPTAAPTPEAAAPRLESVLPDPQAQAQYHIMAGEMAAGRQQAKQAAQEFLLALDGYPDPELAQRATQLAVSARDARLTLRAAQRWLALAADDAGPREIIASLSLDHGDRQQALEQCRELAERHPASRADGLMDCARIASQAAPNRAEDALWLMQQLINDDPQAAAAHHALAVVALRFDQLDLATAAAREARRLEPENRDHQLLEIGILAQSGEIASALTQIKQLVKADPDNTELRLQYARLLLDDGQRAAARQQMQAVLKIDPDDVDANYVMGALALEDDDPVTARRHLSKLLGTTRTAEAALQLGQLAETQGRDDEALAYYAVVQSGPAALEAGLRSIQLLARTERLSVAYELIDAMRSRYPPLKTRLDLTEGELRIQYNDAAGALTLYDRALTRTAPEDAQGHLSLRYGRSLAYEQLGRIDDAEADLRAILSENPDDARALNALGYMLASHTARLDEAEQLVARAQTLEPDDPAIMDSLGWVYFKQGKLAQAIEWLRQAHEQFPDPEVAAHLGEALWVDGQQDQARQVWDAARAQDPNHAVLRETLERLTP